MLSAPARYDKVLPEEMRVARSGSVYMPPPPTPDADAAQAVAIPRRAKR